MSKKLGALHNLADAMSEDILNRPGDDLLCVAAQSWLIQFSGVGILDLPGNNPNDWRREMLTIFPDVSSPLQFAIIDTPFQCQLRRPGRYFLRSLSNRSYRMQPSVLL
jgi:hypothetical protein